MRLLTVALLTAALAAACSETSNDAAAPPVAGPSGPRSTVVSQTAKVLERQFGADADGFYLFTPRERAWDRVVVFVHGHGGPSEITPANHRPWLRHLAALGSAVVYPRYEEQPGGHGAARHIDVAVRSALEVLGKDVPIVGIGYSRGGRLVVDWAAIAPAPAKPRAILSVFPASSEDASPDLSQLDPRTEILILVGDQDEVVGPYGAVELIDALGTSGFDLQRERSTVLRSTPELAVTHLSVLESSPRARALFWQPADRLVAEVLEQG